MIGQAGLAFNNFIVVAVIVTTLYFAREILVPIALAVLLSFVLAPLVKLFQRVRVPRPVAVVLAVVAALAVAISLGTMVMVQVNQLASDLPRYQTTLGQKVHSLRDTLGPNGILKSASNLLKDFSKELETNDSDKPKLVPRSVKTNLSFPKPESFSAMFFTSQGARNWPFLTFTTRPLVPAARMRSVWRQRSGRFRCFFGQHVGRRGAGVILACVAAGHAVTLLLLLTSCGSSTSKPAPVFGGRSIQEDQEWPQELMGGEGSTVLLYQPQVESWKTLLPRTRNRACCVCSTIRAA
jgi:hypothetical protein